MPIFGTLYYVMILTYRCNYDKKHLITTKDMFCIEIIVFNMHYKLA